MMENLGIVLLVYVGLKLQNFSVVHAVTVCLGVVKEMWKEEREYLDNDRRYMEKNNA